MPKLYKIGIPLKTNVNIFRSTNNSNHFNRSDSVHYVRCKTLTFVCWYSDSIRRWPFHLTDWIISIHRMGWPRRRYLVMTSCPLGERVIQSRMAVGRRAMHLFWRKIFYKWIKYNNYPKINYIQWKNEPVRLVISIVVGHNGYLLFIIITIIAIYRRLVLHCRIIESSSRLCRAVVWWIIMTDCMWSVKRVTFFWSLRRREKQNEMAPETVKLTRKLHFSYSNFTLWYFDNNNLIYISKHAFFIHQPINSSIGKKNVNKTRPMA